MKHTLSALYLSCLFLFPGCLEINFATNVNEDGSITREIAVTGDSTAITSSDLTVRIDSTWDVSVTKAEKGSRLLARKRFLTVEDLNRASEGIPGETLQMKASLEKSFQWFFTTMKYREVYHSIRQFDFIPVEEFLSESDLSLFRKKWIEKQESDGDSIQLKRIAEKFEQWDKRNRFEGFYRTLLAGVKRLNDPSLTEDSLAGKKEILFGRITPLLEKNSMEKITAVLDSLLGDAAGKAVAANEEGFRLFQRKHEFMGRVLVNTYNASVSMPGIIVSTNANTLEGNYATWNDVGSLLFLSDYELLMESRVINWWVIILSGLIALAAITFLITGAIRRRSLL